jgi:sugar phosphate permease
MFKRTRGVFYGWWIVISSFFLMLVSAGTAVYGFAAFFDPIYNEMGWSRAETALAFSLRSVEGGIVQPIIGFFVDRIGARKCIIAGILLMSVSLVLISRLSNLFTFYVGFFILAMGNTMASGIPEYSAIANWFRKRRSLALGILTAGAGLSGIMAPVFTSMIDSLGWRETLLTTAPFVLVIGIPLAIIIRHHPEPYGLKPDGDKAEADSPGKIASKEKASGLAPAVTPIKEGLTVKECLKSRIFWLLLLYSGLTQFANSALMVHAMSHLVNVGISRDMAALTMTGYTSFSLVGRLGLSYLGDKYSKKNILIICAAMQGIGILIFSYISITWMIIPFILFYGPGFGGPIPLVPAIQVDYFGTKAFATMRGLMAIGYTVPGIIGPWFAGLVADTTGSYHLAVCAIPIMMMTTIKQRPRLGVQDGIIGGH